MSRKTDDAFQQSAAQPPPTQAPKRMKVTLACAVCRKKKVKCDGVQPSCSRCNSMGLACEYADPPRKRGPPKGYVEVIENRAHRIESLLSAKAPPCLPDDDDNTRDKRSSGNALLTVVVETVAAQGKPNYHPGSYDRLYHLSLANEVESFFAHFNLFFPILSRQHFLHQLQQSPQGLDPLLRYAVLALGCRYSGNSAAQLAMERCKEIWTSRSRDGKSLSTVQALVIMCWHAYMIGDMHDCQVYRGCLAHLVNDLKLYRDPDFGLGIVEMELRRRAFWVAYVIDQWVACCFSAEPFLRQDTRWDCRWPQFEDNQLQAIDSNKLQRQQGPLPMKYALQVTAFSEMIKLTHIVAQHFTMPANLLTPMLTNWFLNLPAYLEYNKPADDAPPSPQSRMYHLLYYTVQIILNRNTDTFGVCMTAANTIIHMAEQMLHQSQHRYLYNTFALSVTLAASVHLDNAMHRNASARIQLDKSIRTLQSAHCLGISVDAAIHKFLSEQCNLHAEDKLSTRKRSRRQLEQEDKFLTMPTQPVDINQVLGLTGLFIEDAYDWSTVLPLQQQQSTTQQQQHSLAVLDAESPASSFESPASSVSDKQSGFDIPELDIYGLFMSQDYTSNDIGILG